MGIIGIIIKRHTYLKSYIMRVLSRSLAYSVRREADGTRHCVGQILVADFLKAEDSTSAVLASQMVQALCKADGTAAASAAAHFLRHVAPSASAVAMLHQHLEVWCRISPISCVM